MSTLKSNEDHADKAIHKLWKLIVAEQQDISFVIVYGISSSIFSLVIPIAAQSLVNSVSFNSLLQPIFVLTSIVAIMLGIASILRLIQIVIVENIQQRIFARISLDLAYRLPRVQIEAYDSSRGTELVNRFFEVLTVQKTAALMLLDGLTIVLQAIVGLVLLAFYHPILLAFDVFLIFIMCVVIWIPAKRAILSSIKESKAKYKVAAWLEEIARNPLLFKLSNASELAITKADEITYEYLSERKKHFKYLISQVAGTLVVQTVVSAMLLGIGSILVIKKQLTLGQLVASELIVTMVVSGFAKLGKFLESFYDLTASVDKLGYLFDLPLEEKKSSNELVLNISSAQNYEIKINKIYFKYNTNIDKTLQDINLIIKPQDRLGVNGINGSGKSSLLDLIIGLRTPTSGTIEVNGIDLRQVFLEDYRSSIAVVRKPEIFDGTVIDNIKLGRPHITIEEINDSLSKVSLSDEISALENGLFTELNGSLNPLSAGQTHRLMIARAIVGKPKLLILDEALENIDIETKEKILKTLFDQNEPWTLIIATHDTLELSYCNKVVRLHDGKLFSDNFSKTEKNLS